MSGWERTYRGLADEVVGRLPSPAAQPGHGPATSPAAFAANFNRQNALVATAARAELLPLLSSAAFSGEEQQPRGVAAGGADPGSSSSSSSSPSSSLSSFSPTVLCANNLGLFYGKFDLEAGPVTRGQLLSLMPFTVNTLVFVEVTGAFLLDILEHNGRMGMASNFVAVDGLHFDVVAAATDRPLADAFGAAPQPGQAKPGFLECRNARVAGRRRVVETSKKKKGGRREETAAEAGETEEARERGEETDEGSEEEAEQPVVAGAWYPMLICDYVLDTLLAGLPAHRTGGVRRRVNFGTDSSNGAAMIESYLKKQEQVGS